MIDWLLIYRNITNKATASEQKRYAKWFKRSYHHRRYSEKLAEYHQKNGVFTPLTDEALLLKLHQLQNESTIIKQEEAHVKKSKTGQRMLFTVSSAAAAIVISFLLLLPYFTPKKELASMGTETKIDVPTLILESGNNIALEGNPNIDKESLIEKIADQKISYLRGNKNLPEFTEPTYNTLVIPSRYTYIVILDDSTEVTLNANTQLRYPVKFTGDKREVFLKGEAYFKVSKNQKPFIVSTNEISVRVYGTEFNVNTNNKESIETVLVSGSVGVTIKNSSSCEIAMIPNQKFTFNTFSKENTVKTVDPENEIAWKNGFFQCDKEKLSIILNEIAEWYGIDFDYTRDEIKEILVSVKLKRSTKLTDLLNAIEEVSKSTIIKISTNKYVIE